jgi:hypothetical protein
MVYAALKAPAAAVGEVCFGLVGIYMAYSGANGAIKVLAARRGISTQEPATPPKKSSKDDEDQEGS